MGVSPPPVVSLVVFVTVMLSVLLFGSRCASSFFQSRLLTTVVATASAASGAAEARGGDCCYCSPLHTCVVLVVSLASSGCVTTIGTTRDLDRVTSARAAAPDVSASSLLAFGGCSLDASFSTPSGLRGQGNEVFGDACVG